MQEHCCLLSCCIVYSRVPSRADSLKMLVPSPLENSEIFFFGKFRFPPKSCDSVKTGKEKNWIPDFESLLLESPEPPDKFVKASL